MVASSLSSVHTPSQLIYRWASREDIPSMAKLLLSNLYDFELHDHFAPDRRARSDEFYFFVLNRVRKYFVQPNCRYMVAERTNLNISGFPQAAEIVGFSAWDAHGDENPLAVEWTKAKGGWLAALEERLVQTELFYYQHFGSNVINYTDFIRTIDQLHASYDTLDSLQSNIHLQFLMVAPAWQKGHGIGRRLLQWGLDVAEQLNLPVILEASLTGYEFYLKHGFRVLTKVRIDTKPEHAYDMPIMLYEKSPSTTP